MSKKLKILISAYACEPDKGSEPGVGWNWAKQISRFHEVWVITRKNNRPSIEKELEENIYQTYIGFILICLDGHLSGKKVIEGFTFIIISGRLVFIF